jgi:predicted PurR-regulated permease PerM
MLMVFFFSLFLQKFAYFSSSRKRVPEPGDFLVRGIFSSSWMPQTNAETRQEARNILNTIFGKLKAWVKGYLSIIMIESTIYITMFLILGVPYAPILGLIAGCTILLPFIGPVTSAILTVLICFSIGNMSMFNILCVGGVYFVVTGMLDQLFLYPKFVGNALGLSTIETIIVVLLGGLFAGLPGMIFAVPTASVLKFIIPKIYECWSR